ncbi:hypothetical protein D3C87_1126580 [compost metagenome]
MFIGKMTSLRFFSGLEAMLHIAGSFKEILEVVCSKSSMYDWSLMPLLCPGIKYAPSALKFKFEGASVFTNGILSVNLVRNGNSLLYIILNPAIVLLTASCP